MSAFKVSVVIPVYNASAYLKQCLDSLVNQTLSQIEIIAVDDGSTDRSWELIQAYEKAYPDKVRGYHKTNGGMSSARNFGLDHVNGEYVGFVDSDDWVEATMFAHLYESIEKHRAKLAVCNFRMVYDHSEIPFIVTDEKHFQAHVNCVWNKLYHASLFQQTRFKEGIRYEDLNLLMKLLPDVPEREIVYCDEIFYNYRQTEGSVMNQPNAQKNLDMISVFDDALDYFAKHPKAFDTHQYAGDLWLEHVTLNTITRLIKQKDTQTKQVIHQLNAYGKKQFPKLFQSEYYRQLPMKRKLIAYLNGHNLNTVSALLLKK